MSTLTETIKDKIFDLKEKVKILNCDREELLIKLCDKQYQINQLSDLAYKLQIDLNQIPTPGQEFYSGCQISEKSQRIKDNLDLQKGVYHA